MSQTQTSSVIEQFFNVGSGLLISMLTWAFIIKPLWEFDTSFSDNVQITLIFTIISLIRGYTWRRLFNHQKLSSLTIKREYNEK